MQWCCVEWQSQRLDLIQSRLRIELAMLQVLPPVDTPAIGVLQHPRLQYPAGSVKLCRVLIDFDEDGLAHVLRLGFVLDDAKGDAKDQPAVPVDDHGEGIIVSRPQ